jgi:hypothetical protein
MDSIIDSLTSSINVFSVTQDDLHFGLKLDNIIKGMEKIDVNNFEKNWIEFKTNYSKLKYLNELSKSIVVTGKFIDTLTTFTTKLDQVNERYLMDIKWYNQDSSIHEKCIEIKKLLEYSISLKNPLLKLQFVMDAYNILFPIIQEESMEDLELFSMQL